MRFPRHKKPEVQQPEDPSMAEISKVGYSYQIRFDPLDSICPYRVVMYLDGKEMGTTHRTAHAYAQSEKDAHAYGRQLVAQCAKFNSHTARTLP